MENSSKYENFLPNINMICGNHIYNSHKFIIIQPMLLTEKTSSLKRVKNVNSCFATGKGLGGQCCNQGCNVS